MIGSKFAPLLVWPLTSILSGTVAQEITSRRFGLRSNNGTADLLSLIAAPLAWDQSNYVNGPVYQDPFYRDLPPDCSSARPGALIKVETITNTSLYTLSPSTALSRIIFQTKDLQGRTLPASAYILWPYNPRRSEDGYQVVASAHGTSGITANCAPSHIRNLWQHYLAPFQLALQGYVVVAPDYAGMGVFHDCNNQPIPFQYLAGPAHANDIVYSVQAARQAFPELSSKFVVMGHSEGGGVAWSVAERQAREPVEGYLGSVAISPVTNASAVTTGAKDALGVGISPGAASINPGFNISDIFTSEGLAAFDVMFDVGGCSAVLNALFLSGGPSPVKSDWRSNPAMQEYQKEILTGGKKLGGPLLVIRGDDDELLQPNLTDFWVQKTIDMFPDSSIEFIRGADADHESVMMATQRTWMDWIHARFAGEPVSKGLKDKHAEPLRPASAIQTALNWYIELVTEPYQTS